MLHRARLTVLALFALGLADAAGCATSVAGPGFEPAPDASGPSADAQHSPSQDAAEASQNATTPPDANSQDAQLEAQGVDADATTDAPQDAQSDATDAASDAPDAPSPYTHTITIDGKDDFTSSEFFPTTTGAFHAHVAWDTSALFIGYDGPDIAAGVVGAGTKWVFAYIDTGSAAGSATGKTYNTETPAFPAGLRPLFYLRWKVDDSFITLENYSGGAWSSVNNPNVTHARGGTFVEFRVPFATLGNPSAVSLVTLMMNEVVGAEAAYAGLYAGNFTDGYHATLDITRWLLADRAGGAAPNDASRLRP
jgi:hypothetical protein